MAHNLINRKGVKDFILKKLEADRPWLKITRVSSQSLDKYEAEIRIMIEKDIKCHPSIGKTFKV